MITCQFEDGGKAHLRHVVIDMIMIRGNQILLVKRSSKFLEGGKYALIGGYLDLHETLEHCVIREAREETGYEVTIDKLFLIVDNAHRKNDERNNLAFTYVVSPVKKVGEPDDENTEMKWFSLDSLPSDSEMAFDHLEMIHLYRTYLTKPFSVPVVVSY